MLYTIAVVLILLWLLGLLSSYAMGGFIHALLVGLAIAGIVYSAIFITGSPQNISETITQFSGRIFCALGLGSLISLLAFVGLGAVNRNRLDRRREDCRRLAAKVLESRLGNLRESEATAPEIPPEESKA